MADWKSFTLAVPGQDVFDGVRDTLQTLLVYLEVLKAVLDTVKTFLIDFGNPIIALVQALIALIESLFNALKQTGLFALYDVPSLSDRDFETFTGGYNGFLSRWKGSLLDGRDPNRPQPVVGGNQSGFVLFYLEDTNLFALLDRIKSLLSFFGGELRTPQYGAPVGLQVFPVNDKRDPVLAVSRILESAPSSLVVEWQLPSDKGIAPSNFKSLLASTAAEFVPPKFLLERTTQPGGYPLTAVARTQLRKNGQDVTVVVPVREKTGEPFLRFDSATVIDASTNTATFLSGATGTYRYIDTSVEPGVSYYYRVRSFSGNLTMEGGVPKDTGPIAGPNSDGTDYTASYVGESLVMGAPSPIVSGRLPVTLPGYDLFGTLVQFFQVCFSLNFHRPPAPDATFDVEGKNTGVTGPAQVGRGSIPNVLSTYLSTEFIPASPAQVIPSPVTGKVSEFPWEQLLVRRKSRELAVAVASAMLENEGTAQQFKTLMEAPLPKGPFGFDFGTLSGVTTLQQAVESLPLPQDAFAAANANAKIVAQTYERAFVDASFRLNFLEALRFLRSFTLGGVKPDWIQVSLLRDIVPWTGQILYEVLAKIQALVDAYNGTLQEIRDFIDLIERKIETLERFIQFIIALLDEIESLSISAKVLVVNAGTGGIPAWMNLLDTAGGDRPEGGPKEYTSSVTLAYSAVDASAYVNAFSILFGG